jgi:hypothetical protein
MLSVLEPQPPLLPDLLSPRPALPPDLGWYLIQRLELLIECKRDELVTKLSGVMICEWENSASIVVMMFGHHMLLIIRVIAAPFPYQQIPPAHW